MEMVRVTETKFIGKGLRYVEFAGLSTDDKPTVKVATGSLFMEVDTGDVYAYDEENEEWNKVAELGGGA